MESEVYSTNPNPDKAALRAPQRVRIKARSAGNGSPLVKQPNAESGRLWSSRAIESKSP